MLACATPWPLRFRATFSSFREKLTKILLFLAATGLFFANFVHCN